MKHCQQCGQLITGEAEEVTPHSASGARPTLWRHANAAECRRAIRS